MIKQFIALLFLVATTTTFAQEDIYPPAEGKAVIYFVRTPSPGSLMNIRFFEKGNYLGKFNGVNYLRVEVDPGESIFWAKAENVDFIETDLKEGGIYLVETRGRMGGFSAAVKLFLVDFNDEKQMKRINKVFEKKEGVAIEEEDITKGQQNTSVIQQGMMTVVKKRKSKPHKVKRLAQDMNYVME